MLCKLLLEGNPADLAAYRARLRWLRPLCAAAKVLGVGTILFAQLGVPRLLEPGPQRSFFRGFYTGIGVFVAVAAVAAFFLLGRLLKDEAALRRRFTECTDERNRSIDQKALQSAGAVVFAGLYILLLAAGLFAPVLFVFCLAGVLAYCLLFLGFRLYYRHKL